MMPPAPEAQPRPFDWPQEPEWHRMIAEAAYYLAQKRGFTGENALDDWLTAEQEIRQVISPTVASEAPMNDTTSQNQPEQNQPQPDAKTPADASQPRQGVSRFEKFAATQAAGDGIQGDPLKKNKSIDERIGANMADRK